MPKPDFMPRDSEDYGRAKIRLALSYAPPIKPCRDCGGPVVDGYCCTRCGSTNPRRKVSILNLFQNGNSSKMPNQLPHDLCRCVSPTCHVRDLCARFMDSPAGPHTPYADLTNECQDIGVEQMFIPFKPKP